jgi:threonine dehydrogenase-like Zn-dependent dehydrogenase
MRALTVEPGNAHSARLENVPEPPLSDGELLVESLALGICGTDREILAGEHGSAPKGESRLILGHESLGRILEAPPGSGFAPGELVVGIVRRPDPVPCPSCAAGEWDMCRNGRYTERGIKDSHGYGAERFRLERDFAIKIDPALGLKGVLLEPASILAKAWDQTDHVGRRSAAWKPRTLLVIGAGTIGLLAALMGVQRGLDVHVLDHHAHAAKSDIVAALGGTYHAGGMDSVANLEPDILMECSGAPDAIANVLARTAPAGVLCLIGVTSSGHDFKVDIGQFNHTTVLDNHAIIGTVNANRKHYESAAASLARADQGWLSKLITRRVPLEEWRDALDHRAHDIKVVMEFGR